MKSFRNWSTLEKALLGGVVLLLCGAALLVVLVLGGFFVEEELAQQTAANATPVAEIATLPPLDNPVAETIDNPAAETQAGQPAAQSQPDTQSITLSATSGAPGTTITVSGEGWPAGSRWCPQTRQFTRSTVPWSMKTVAFPWRSSCPPTHAG
jgi:hypothetical protein